MNHQVRSEFGRYYTKPAIGQLMVELMGRQKPKTLFDLGVGGGALTIAATRQWSNLNLLTIDVDRTSDKRLTKLLATEEIRSHCHLNADALGPNLASVVKNKFGKFDAAVCNPPFTTPVWRKGFDEMLEESGFGGCMPVLADSDSALLFLSQALRILGEKSTLGIILPDSLISGAKYRKFRHELLTRYRVETVVRLPSWSFMHTQAAAHIVIIRKGVGGTTNIPLRKFANGGLSSDITTVDLDQATLRMDYNFHAVARTKPTIAANLVVQRLGNLVVTIRRGSLEATASRQMGIRVFHTTDMNELSLGKWINLGGRCPKDADKQIWAKTGDILIARVGRNFDRKILGVGGGGALLTDCVYRVRMPDDLAKVTLSQLSSDYGRAWLSSRSSGVGAKHLSLADLKDFPVQLER